MYDIYIELKLRHEIHFSLSFTLKGKHHHWGSKDLLLLKDETFQIMLWQNHIYFRKLPFIFFNFSLKESNFEQSNLFHPLCCETTNMTMTKINYLTIILASQWWRQVGDANLKHRMPLLCEAWEAHQHRKHRRVEGKQKALAHNRIVDCPKSGISEREAIEIPPNLCFFFCYLNRNLPVISGSDQRKVMDSSCKQL